jgi:hypothetical protein
VYQTSLSLSLSLSLSFSLFTFLFVHHTSTLPFSIFISFCVSDIYFISLYFHISFCASDIFFSFSFHISLCASHSYSPSLFSHFFLCITHLPDEAWSRHPKHPAVNNTRLLYYIYMLCLVGWRAPYCRYKVVCCLGQQLQERRLVSLLRAMSPSPAVFVSVLLCKSCYISMNPVFRLHPTMSAAGDGELGTPPSTFAVKLDENSTLPLL